jgi:hypothetical protein
MINRSFFTGLLVAAATVTGVLAQASSAAAFTWNNAWQQPQIFRGADVGFNHRPFQQFVNRERVAIPNSGQRLINADNLFLKHDHNVSVSFINEGAGYRNQLAFRTTGATNRSGLLFNDISCNGSYDGGRCVIGGADTLKFGDTVKMGKITGGSLLDFGLRANGFNRGNNAYIFGTPAAANPDGLNHVIAYTYGSRYLVLGFEDLYGDGRSSQGRFNERSDRDFNDTVFVVDVGEKNVACLNAGNCRTAPEPAMALGLLGLGATAIWKRRQVG